MDGTDLDMATFNGAFFVGNQRDANGDTISEETMREIYEEWKALTCRRREAMRTCKTYNYWDDLFTDIRRPESLLDLANMFLRRIRVVLVKNVDGDGNIIAWRLRWWVAVLDEIHEAGNCNRCKMKIMGDQDESCSVL